jgi:hypothetical protein
MADNHDRFQRFEMADQYKGRAIEFICEALSVYLEWKQENSAKGRALPLFHTSLKMKISRQTLTRPFDSDQIRSCTKW